MAGQRVTEGGGNQAASYGKYRQRQFLSHAWRQLSWWFVLGYGVLEALTALLDWPWLQQWRLAIAAGWLVVSLLIAAWAGIRAVRSLVAYRVTLGTSGWVEVDIGDYFDNLERHPGAASVFGANDRLATSGLGQYSLHEHFLVEYFDGRGVSRADAQKDLDGALVSRKLLSRWRTGQMAHSRRPAYPFGTVTDQVFTDKTGGRRRAFFVVNSRRVADHEFSGSGASFSAVNRVWDFHETADLVSLTLVFPLLGTGNTKDMSKTQSALRIIDEYFARLERSDKVRVERLVISILPAAVESGEIDLAVLHQYLEARAAVHLSD